MSRKQELHDQIKELDKKKKPLEEELRQIYLNEEKDVEARLNACEQNKGKFGLDELRFAAYTRCSCGAGMCYPKDIGMHGAWYCSDILLGRAIPSGQEGAKMHDKLPFMFYEIKSEDQPSANGATTRPSN